MKTLKKAAVLTLVLGMLAATAMKADAGHKGKGSSHGHRGGHHHHHRRYRPTYHAPKPVCPPITVVPAGSVITLPGYFGRHPGHVILELAGAKLHAKVLGWSHAGIKVLLPAIDLAAPAAGSLVVIRWDKYVYRPFPVKILPPVAPPAVAGHPGFRGPSPSPQAVPSHVQHQGPQAVAGQPGFSAPTAVVPPVPAQKIIVQPQGSGQQAAGLNPQATNATPTGTFGQAGVPFQVK